jgi:glycosyltransferase involved in cell wall biosynthesis
LHVVDDWSPRRSTAWLITSTTATRAVVAFRDGLPVPPRGPAGNLLVCPVTIDHPGEWPDDSDATRVLARLARSHRARVLHAHGPEVAAVVAKVASSLGLPWLLTVDDDAVGREGVPRQAESAVAVLVPTEQARAGLIARGVPEQRCRLLRVGVALDVTEEPPGSVSRTDVVLRHEIGARAAELDSIYLAIGSGRPLPAAPADRRELPTVSVVVPTYNRRDLVAETLGALARQTYPADLMEVVVVDDFSTDGTAESLAAMSVPWRLRVSRPPTKEYAAGARNQGVADATGTIVAFTDDDCRPEPTWLEAMVAGFDDGIGVVQGKTVPDPDQPRGPWSRTISTPAEYGLYETANLAFRRSALDAAGTPPFATAIPMELARVLGRRLGTPGIGEDVELGWRIRRTGVGTRFASHAVVRHEVSPGSVRTVLRDAVRAAGFPLLVRHVPELRRAFLWRGWALRSAHLLLLLAIAALVVTVWWPYAALGVLPYAWSVVRPDRAGRRGRVRQAPMTVLRDVVELAGCLWGSICARRLVL